MALARATRKGTLARGWSYQDWGWFSPLNREPTFPNNDGRRLVITLGRLAVMVREAQGTGDAMGGIEMLGLLEDIARELEVFGCACVFEADEVHPHGWVRITEGPTPARTFDYYTCWQCGRPIQIDPANCFGWSHVEAQEYPDHGAEPNDPGYVKS